VRKYKDDDKKKKKDKSCKKDKKFLKKKSLILVKTGTLVMRVPNQKVVTWLPKSSRANHK
jgi:hypothetical protein